MDNNSEFAQRAATAADALNEYGHLPRIGLMTITERSVFVSPAAHGHEGIVAVGQWAKAFEVPVTLKVSPNWEITAALKLRGEVDVQMYVNLATQELHELGVRLGVVMSPAGAKVSGEQLLSALHVEPAEPAPAAAEQPVDAQRYR